MSDEKPTRLDHENIRAILSGNVWSTNLLIRCCWQLLDEHDEVVAQRDEAREALKRMAEQRDEAQGKVDELRANLNEIKDIVGWFEPGDEQRAISLRDQIWEQVTA